MEGSNIWYDGWAIPKYARNVKAASYFMNYLCRPDIVSRNMEVTGYVSTVAHPGNIGGKDRYDADRVLGRKLFLRTGSGAYPDRPGSISGPEDRGTFVP